MKKLTAFCVIFTLLYQVSAPAQDVLTLREAIQESWTHRKNIEAEALNPKIQNLQSQALKKKYAPQVSLEYEYQYNPILQSSILPVGKFNPALPSDAKESVQFGTTWSQAAGINLLQPLIDEKVKQQIRESHLNEQLASASLSTQKYLLAYEVTKAYLELWLQQQQWASSVIDSTGTWESYQMQLQRFQQGRLLKYDLNKALINHHNAVQKVRDARSQLMKSKIYLQNLTGRPLNPLENIQPDSNFFKSGFEKWMRLSPRWDSLPDIRQLSLQQQLALQQQQSEKSKYLPTLSLKGFLGANQYSNVLEPFAAHSWFGYSYLGIDAKLPLLFGEDKKRKLRELQLQSDQYRLQKEDESSQYQEQAATAQLQLYNLQGRIQNQEANLTLQRESVTLIRERVAMGQETAESLNNEELELMRMESQLAESQRQGWLYWLDYVKANGLLETLWEPSR